MLRLDPYAVLPIRYFPSGRSKRRINEYCARVWAQCLSFSWLRLGFAVRFGRPVNRHVCAGAAEQRNAGEIMGSGRQQAACEKAVWAEGASGAATRTIGQISSLPFAGGGNPAWTQSEALPCANRKEEYTSTNKSLVGWSVTPAPFNKK